MSRIHRGAMLALTLALPLAAAGAAWQRPVLPAGAGPQRLEVDLPLLGAARAGLADLRLRDRGGAEVPYVLVAPGKGEGPWVKARLLPLPATRTASGVELDLGGLVRTGRLRLEGLRAPFLKRFRLEASGDRQHWTDLVQQGSLFDLPGEGLCLLSVDFPAGDYRYLRLQWDDRSSAPLGLPASAWVQRPGQAGAALVAPLSFQSRAGEPGVSRFTVRLPGPGLPIRALQVAVAGQGPLLRLAKVVESRLEATGLAPQQLGQHRLRRAQADGASAADLRIPISAPQGMELDIRVEDGNNPPLVLTGVQAELEPQPWIYFETRDGSELTASCGDPRLARPRYDLEALAEQLGRGTTGSAHWGPLPVAPAAPALPGAASGLGGAPAGPVLDRAGFRYHRRVPTAAPGLSALVLDSHVLAHSAHLADLRLLDPTGRQLPYLLEQRDEPLSLALQVGPGRLQERTSHYRLALPEAGLAEARLVLETSARVFQRRVRVQESATGGELRTLADQDWRHGDPDQPAPALVLALPAATGTDLELTVEEGDNPPLPLVASRLLLPTWRLRFFQPEGAVTLCYGRELNPPSYDLALLAEQLRTAPARELTLGPEGAERSAGPNLKYGFWAVLVLAVAGLLFLLARLVKPDPVEPG